MTFGLRQSPFNTLCVGVQNDKLFFTCSLLYSSCSASSASHARRHRPHTRKDVSSFLMVAVARAIASFLFGLGTNSETPDRSVLKEWPMLHQPRVAGWHVESEPNDGGDAAFEIVASQTASDQRLPPNTTCSLNAPHLRATIRTLLERCEVPRERDSTPPAVSVCFDSPLASMRTT